MSDVERPSEITAQETKVLLDAGDCLLIDCREEEEHQVARIDGAVLVPMSRWIELVDVEAWKNQHVVVHCHHGVRSMRVALWLRNNGIPAAQSMTGGIEAWSLEVDNDIPRY